MVQDIVITQAVRTPVGTLGGALAAVTAPKLGAVCVNELLRRSGLQPEAVDEIIISNVVSAGLGQCPARQAALFGGLTDAVAALTINKVCGGGLKAIVLAYQAVKVGDAKIVFAGGMESMSNVPFALPKARFGYRLGHGKLLDLMIHDGLWCPFDDQHMGNTGEIIAEKFSVSRERQDEYAYNSHRKAVAAIEAGRFKKEIVPVTIPQRRGAPIVVDTDEGPRAGTSVEKLAKLRPVFKKDGTVTAGNAPSVNDGASAAIVMSSDEARARNLKPMAKIVSYATSGLAPEMVMLAPVPAIRMALEKANLTLDDIDIVELNEAFSVQAIVCCEELGLDLAKVNCNGGAVALGHPIGATGARIMTTLLHQMEARDLKRGIAALCLGGGNAVAMIVER
ncbi:acetyl-CoA C-acetyltransferase [bacterium]|nr:acetyl-CoA C-acetyltransferase [bacterium]